MTRSIAARVARLEARHKAAVNKPKGVIGGLPETYVEEIEGVLYLRRPETPTGQPFAQYARNQQAELRNELLRLFGDMSDDPQAAFTRDSVGNSPAPLKPGRKQPNFIHLADGTEIKIKRN
ncbi:hypothetical protein ACEN2J_11130 [Pseudorhodobacter sp. W20_MBD10_FR17]|uniref:hypothetical protein n=1 Tax=Pseudorhodobacter sp. W20_MBD10_FR17 TaxID=3240266 RepID=UPI003F9A9DDC